MAKRHFTESQVRHCFQQYYVDIPERAEQRIELRHIALLDETTPPTWRVDYVVIDLHPSGASERHRFHAILLLAERKNTQGKPELHAVSMTKLPKGCTTVEDEDKIIAGYENSGW